MQRGLEVVWQTLAFAAFALAMALSGCDDKPRPEGGDPVPAPAPSSSGSAATPAAKSALTVVIAYGSEKKTWLEEQARKFEAGGAKTKSGRPIKIEGQALGSGEANQAILDGQLKPHVLSPASAIYISLLNDAWLSRDGHTKALTRAGDPLVLSPIVVAIWKPMAEALGWPKKQLGWADLVKVHADPKGWGAFGRPEWGDVKLGHTHPEYSNSGFLAVLAEAYAGAKKTRGLSAADLEAKSTMKFLEDVEGTMVHYGKSTGFFAEKMAERGPSYISAAVLYENLVIESYSAKTKPEQPIVAIYPVEGTFWSDHPYAILDADWVGADERDAAEQFQAFLKAKPQQERALALGFRPADASIPMGAPLDEAHGVDPKQPQTLLEVPPPATLQKLLAVWQATKKATDVILVFDKSGSMKGKPLAEAKEGAKAFLTMLHDRDEVSLLFFDGVVYPPYGPVKLADSRAKLIERVDGAIADGGTALYDATAKAYEIAQKKAKATPGRIHAVVVMTDGKDESSKLPLPGLTARFSDEAAPVKVFTIAYGDGADASILTNIANAAKGSTARGNPENIVQVYKDMGAFF